MCLWYWYPTIDTRLIPFGTSVVPSQRTLPRSVRSVRSLFVGLAVISSDHACRPHKFSQFTFVFTFKCVMHFTSPLESSSKEHIQRVQTFKFSFLCTFMFRVYNKHNHVRAAHVTTNETGLLSERRQLSAFNFRTRTWGQPSSCRTFVAVLAAWANKLGTLACSQPTKSTSKPIHPSS